MAASSSPSDQHTERHPHGHHRNPSLRRPNLARRPRPGHPLGHFTVEITFDTADQVTFHVTGGAIAGRTETMPYTTTQVRDGLYVIRWTEPDAGGHVTHIEDYDNGTCMASSVVGEQFIQLAGTWTRVK